MKKHGKYINKLKSNKQLLLTGLVGVFVGALAGYAVWHKPLTGHDIRYQLASKSQIQEAKDEVRQKFLDQNTKDCTNNPNPTQTEARVKKFDEYLKVNKYANRAVIRGCNDADNLLAKDPLSGEWFQTTVNISLDLRANPVWQAECLIDDITTSDDVIRAENSSIDVSNLQKCAYIKQSEQVAKILEEDFKEFDEKPTNKDIDSYLERSDSSDL